MRERGYLYITGGSEREKFTAEAVRSARSLKAVDKDAHITLISDKDVKEDVFNDVLVEEMTPDFDGEMTPEARERYACLLYKVSKIGNTPYRTTFFLDTDTYFYEDAGCLFTLAEYYDVCVAPAPRDRKEGIINGEPAKGHYPYNTGVMIFRKDRPAEELFKKWQDIFKDKILNGMAEKRLENDQTSFIEAVMESKARLYLLDNVWNARFPFSIALYGTVKIVHGRTSDYEELGRKINISPRARYWDAVTGYCYFPGDPRPS